MALIKMNFLSDVLGLQTNVTLVLPSMSFADKLAGSKSYYRQGMKFQTLWLLHGGSGDDSDWTNFTSVQRYAEANKVAVVMAAANDSWYVDMANGGRYFTYFTEELPAMCRAFYPLSDRREDNFVAGLSMGGNGAMRLGLKRPDLYNTVLCMSGVAPTVEDLADPNGFFYPKDNAERRRRMENVFGDLTQLAGSPEDMYAVAKDNVRAGKALPRFLFGCGDKDFALPGVQKAHAFLKETGYDSSLEVIPGYGHEWDFWDLYIRKAMESLFVLKRAAI